ncbi:hypothetical protein [Nonomuraea sp. MG754425]|uniref:hypothetical protein n=1 Tax=Nonomuraea sp. MG754425 TaxID=2570319 RepID=UPI001F45F328|nr:hypothetical protein [Nonomuraea sp. MG754425]
MTPRESRRLAGEQGPPAQPRRPTPEDRLRLAEAQSRVVAALVTGAEPPEGFDPARLRAQAASLVAKRRGIVVRIRPDTAAAAGLGLVAEFAAYARARATPPPGYRADADDFAAWLRGRGLLPDEPAPRRPWWSRLPGLR